MKPKKYTEAQRTERRAQQAARALLADRSILANEVRIGRHVEALPPPDRERWLLLTLGDVHPSTAAVLAMCAQMDMDEPEPQEPPLYADPVDDRAEEMHDVAHDMEAVP